ncbi:MAG: hypothetical protein ACRDVW_00200 [Acidimicrobiales bacterium]
MGRADYDAWSHRLLESQIGFVVPSSWEGEPIGRLCFLHPDTSLAMVREITSTVT